MVPIESLFARLQRSTFRSRFRLGVKERQYCYDKGAEVIDQHAADFIARRLAPARIPNDGKQTAVAAVWRSGTPSRAGAGSATKSSATWCRLFTTGW